MKTTWAIASRIGVLIGLFLSTASSSVAVQDPHQGNGTSAIFDGETNENEAPPGAPHYLMAVIGDSISAASLANLRYLRSIAIPEEASDDEAAIQSSFKKLFNNKRTYSWASGKRIRSQFVLLDRYYQAMGDPKKLTVLNVAVPGEVAGGLLPQVDRIIAELATGRYEKLAYLTIMIGANDACSTESAEGTPNEAFRVRLREMYARLASIRQNEPVRILVSGMPNIPDLARDEVKSAKTVLGLSCQKMRYETLGFCRPLTRWMTEEERLKSESVVVKKNEILREEAERARNEHPNLDIVFTNALFYQQLPPEVLTVDCFHPSAVGQEGLSELLWNDQPWFN